ncbi:MAG: AgmX/PglI C-terminal domain-containing protein [Myxococcales bacterium]|nr:AgmX/PglI C-terminal domain-containing protein [Myxococcales bacterium]
MRRPSRAGASRAPLLVLLLHLLGASACGPSALRAGLRDEIADELKRVNSALARCYTKGLRKNELLRGRVAVTFRVGQAGDFEDINVSGAAVKSAELTRCVQQSLTGLGLYRPPERQVDVSYAIEFAQAAAPGGKSLQSAPLETPRPTPQKK